MVIEVDEYVTLFKGLCELQSIHDEIVKSNEVLSDPNNPFIDNGQSSSERFNGFADEMLQKIQYIRMMTRQAEVI